MTLYKISYFGGLIPFHFMFGKLQELFPYEKPKKSEGTCHVEQQTPVVHKRNDGQELNHSFLICLRTENESVVKRRIFIVTKSFDIFNVC